MDTTDKVLVGSVAVTAVAATILFFGWQKSEVQSSKIAAPKSLPHKAVATEPSVSVFVLEGDEIRQLPTTRTANGGVGFTVHLPSTQPSTEPFAKEASNED
jgi:hypothetical protein